MIVFFQSNILSFPLRLAGSGYINEFIFSYASNRIFKNIIIYPIIFISWHNDYTH